MSRKGVYRFYDRDTLCRSGVMHIETTAQAMRFARV
jgi:hypothetical protein